MGGDASFAVTRFRLEGRRVWSGDGESFHCLLLLSGQAVLRFDGGELPLSAGDSAFLPADCGRLVMLGDADVLDVFLPPAAAYPDLLG